MNVRLNVEDLPFPAALRAVHKEAPGSYLGVNRAFLDLFGLSERPESPSAFMGSGSRGSDEMDRRVATERGTVTYPIRLEGHAISVEKSPIVRGDEVSAVLTVMIDRSKNGDAEALHIAPVAEVASEPITLLAIDGAGVRIISQNRASLDFSEFIESESIHESFTETAEQARTDLHELAMRAIERGAPTQEELVIADRHYSICSEVISDVGEQPSLVSQTMTDVSDRSRCEWLEQLVDIAGAETVAAATDLAFEAVRRLLGFDRAALLRFNGDAVEVFASTVEIDPEQSSHADRNLIDALRLPGVVRLPGTAADPALLRELGVVVGAALPVHADGAAWGTFIIGHSSAHANDLTTLALSMLESLGSTLGMVIGRDRIKQRLEESNSRLETYAHAAAHDLRSPLRRIRSFSQILQARLEVEEIDRVQLRDFAERISNGAERLDALLGSMLEHASIDNLSVERHEYSKLHAFAVRICDGITELSHEPKPTLVVKDLPEVRLPASAAERVLRSLIDNALKYSPPERTPTIEISSKPFDGGVRVLVGDSGVGIDPAAADTVFQRFNQLVNQTSGSGLSVVERLLESGGAKVWLEPGLGAGATYVVEFPTASMRPALVGFASRNISTTDSPDETA